MGSFREYHSETRLTQTVCLRIVYAETKNSGRRIQLAERNDMKNLMDRVELMANLSD